MNSKKTTKKGFCKRQFWISSKELDWFYEKNIYNSSMKQSIKHIDDVILRIEELKGESKYTEARETALQALAKHTDDYRIYEELADIYIFE